MAIKGSVDDITTMYTWNRAVEKLEAKYFAANAASQRATFERGRLIIFDQFACQYIFNGRTRTIIQQSYEWKTATVTDETTLGFVRYATDSLLFGERSCWSNDTWNNQECKEAPLFEATVEQPCQFDCVHVLCHMRKSDYTTFIVLVAHFVKNRV